MGITQDRPIGNSNPLSLNTAMATSSHLHMLDLSSSRILLSLLTCVMLLVGQFLPVQPAYGKSRHAPELVADEFYGWYLKTLASDEDPFTAKREKLSTFVSRQLIAEIERQINSPDGIKEDYFLKAQDYLNEWQEARHASRPVRRGATSVLFMTLGTEPGKTRTVELTMTMEKRVWKIRRVELADAPQ